MASLGLSALTGSGCDPEPDSRYASPAATIGTLLTSFGCEAVTQEEIRERLSRGERFELGDPVSFHSAFVDYRGTVDEGLTGYVFGLVATGKDDLTIERSGGRAYAFPKPSDRTQHIVLLERQGHWLVSLSESVPEPVQVALRAEHARARTEIARASAGR